MTVGEGDLLPLREALALVPVSKHTLYRLAEAGIIEARRVPLPGGGSRVLFVRLSLEEYLSGLRRAPEPEPLDVDGVLERIRGEAP